MPVCVCVCMCVCVCACVCVCVHARAYVTCVLDCVFGNSENVQTVYKVCKLMYCTIVQMCVK